GAKVNGKLVSLSYTLQTKDKIEIVTINRGGPSLDWLNEDLGYVRTHRARQKIKHYFRKLNRDKHIQLGRELLEKELRRLGVSATYSFELTALLLNYDDLDDFLAVVGAGDIGAAQIANRILDEENKRQRQLEENQIKTKPRYTPLIEDKSNGVQIMGSTGLLTTLATCCNPVPGDPILGYVTRGRGVTVHRGDCRNIHNLQDPERLINVTWGGQTSEQRYVIPVEVIAYDRDGLLRDVSTVIADEKINITDVRVHTRQDIATIRVVLELKNITQLMRALDKIEQIDSVTEVYRCKPG
ncbi:MAG: bifunctional (p)ppGpp synthetase/guanosine-3',5'-bis(diphosphate) 3'-pyrophosphohydrolase, partial [Armatimonadetes bacterium]|nr:bifunctional (p)ppGpp synthetase/guanosine-3',5'-bis(diphosphate) 3'-pyrophosphohydrolase [Anaerolineae bacterium]